MSNTKIIFDSVSPEKDGAVTRQKKSGIVLRSSSWDAAEDAGRDEKVKAAVEAAGYELPEEPLPEREDASLTPEQRRERDFRDYGLQCDEARKQYDDWDSVVGTSQIYIGVPVQEALLTMPNGARVVHFLAKHPSIARKLGETCKTNPKAAVAEVRKLAVTIPSPDRASSAPARPANPENMTFAQLSRLPNYPGKGRDLRRCRGR